MRRDCKKKIKIASEWEREREKKLGDSVSLTKSFFPFVRVCYLFTFFSSLPVRFIFSYFFSIHPSATATVWQYCVYIYILYTCIRSHTSALRVLKETERDVRTHTCVYYIDCVYVYRHTIYYSSDDSRGDVSFYSDSYQWRGYLRVAPAWVFR